MSFRLFIYYCAVFGGCAAFFGWMLSRWVPFEHKVAEAALQGMLLGTMVAFLLGLIDALWTSGGQILAVGSRVIGALFIGCIGGFLGGGIGQIFYGFTQQWPLVSGASASLAGRSPASDRALPSASSTSSLASAE
jgi:hypothetical protein